MPKQSAGLLLFRERDGRLEVLLVHPGGPFWAKKDDGAWSIPKGEFTPDEDPLAAALREFEEETGSQIAGETIPLEPVRQSGGKLVHAWAIKADFDPATLTSNTFEIEWPPKSGKLREFPEIDRAEWFSLDVATRRILKGQVELLMQLQKLTQETDMADRSKQRGKEPGGDLQSQERVKSSIGQPKKTGMKGADERKQKPGRKK